MKQIPRLRDPTRRNSARKRKSGRSARDDKSEKGQERRALQKMADAKNAPAFPNAERMCRILQKTAGAKNAPTALWESR